MAEGNKYVYHYTDKEGLDGIIKDGGIRPSVDTKKDAVLGKGVYFTPLPPSTASDKLLDNNYDNATKDPSKVDYYIKIDKDKAGRYKEHHGDRIIGVVPGNKPLSLTAADAVGVRNPDGTYEEYKLKKK